MSPLLAQLKIYCAAHSHEAAMTLRLHKFLDAAQTQSPFARELVGLAPEHGHVTGSAWIVNREYSRVVLVYHAKLGKWVQPGGHCDGESDVLAVAKREAEEETGLHVTSLSEDIFDVDVHEIPEYWNTPAHLHFDVRYLLLADDAQRPVCSNESTAVRWVSLDEASTLSGEASITRMIEKTRRLQSALTNRS